MARSLLFALTLTLASAAFAQPAQERHSEVRLLVPADGNLAGRLIEQGVYLDHVVREQTPAGLAFLATLSARELAAARAAGVQVEVLVEDVAAEVAARPPFTEADRAAARAGGRVEGNIFGTMAGFPHYAEVLAILDSMRAQFPHLITARDSIGAGHNGTPIWLLEITDNPGVDEGEPEVLYTALHHAREPAAITTVLYYMWYLLEQHGTDSLATALVDNRRMFF
ncbi:MAG TPA: M14 family zinc carboxypeptidase, partial [Rubricoccaceae bacterium]|nr:M14 family zinc carboxypeptidase [Rubricoccaceae bacterium]